MACGSDRCWLRLTVGASARVLGVRRDWLWFCGGVGGADAPATAQAQSLGLPRL